MPIQIKYGRFSLSLIITPEIVVYLVDLIRHAC